MSTKIYQAFRINKTDVNGIRRFINDLQSVYYEYLKTYRDYHILDCFSNMTELIPYYKENDHEAYNKMVITIAGRIQKQNIEYTGDCDELEKPTIKFFNGHSATLKSICEKYMMSYMCEEDLFTHEPDINAELAIYGIPEIKSGRKYCLFMYFGHIFSEFMSRLLEGEVKVPGAEKLMTEYDIKDWHYQNQTDRPENISASEWNRREKNWDSVMDSSIPGYESIFVQLYNADRFEHDCDMEMIDIWYSKDSEQKDKYFENLASMMNETTDKRLEHYARTETLKQLINTSRADEADVKRTFQNLMQRIDSGETVDNNITEILAGVREKIRPYVETMSADEIKKTMNGKPLPWETSL